MLALIVGTYLLCPRCRAARQLSPVLVSYFNNPVLPVAQALR